MVAVKKFDSSCPSKMTEDFKKEVNILSSLNHKNIVKLLGFCDKRNNTYLVSELMEGGSLYNHINDKSNTFFNWKTNLIIIKDIVCGMVYLHSKNILHLDLKSLNILLNKERNIAKIVDFGLSQIATITSTSTRAQASRVAKGTTRYMPCEISKGMKPTNRSDVWSFGCILLEFLTRELPFYPLPDNAIFFMLQNDSADIPMNFDTKSPQLIAHLISKCLDRKPNLRPSFNEIEDLLKQVDEEKFKVTLKSQQIKLQSIPQISNITTKKCLNSVLDGIKINNNANGINTNLEENDRTFRNFQFGVGRQCGLGNQCGLGRQSAIPCEYDDSKHDFDLREVLANLPR